MGASKSSTIAAEKASHQFDLASSPSSVDDLQTFALSRLPVSGITRMRLAGDRLNDINSVVSMAEESQRSKYSPEMPSKAPGSQYLSTSSRQA